MKAIAQALMAKSFQDTCTVSGKNYKIVELVYSNKFDLTIKFSKKELDSTLKSSPAVNTKQSIFFYLLKPTDHNKGGIVNFYDVYSKILVDSKISQTINEYSADNESFFAYIVGQFVSPVTSDGKGYGSQQSPGTGNAYADLIRGQTQRTPDNSAGVLLVKSFFDITAFKYDDKAYANNNKGRSTHIETNMSLLISQMVLNVKGQTVGTDENIKFKNVIDYVLQKVGANKINKTAEIYKIDGVGKKNLSDFLSINSGDLSTYISQKIGTTIDPNAAAAAKTVTATKTTANAAKATPAKAAAAKAAPAKAAPPKAAPPKAAPPKAAPPKAAPPPPPPQPKAQPKAQR